MAKAGITTSKYQLKKARRFVASRLDTLHHQNVVPWVADRVRVDTGRMRASVDASFAEIEGDLITADITIGGTDEYGTVYDTQTLRKVDYTAALYGPGGYADGELDEVVEDLVNDAEDVYNGRSI